MVRFLGPLRRPRTGEMGLYLGLCLLSAGTLAFELTLTRIFSVTQFYHFAFVVVSLALLGFGASGSLLALFPGWSQHKLRPKLGWLALGCAGSIIGSYLVINWLPFDSYAIAWDGRQLGYLALYFLSLAVPFGFSGLAVGLTLASRPEQSNRAYAVNLLGSAAGCLVLLPALPPLGGEGMVLLAAGLVLLAAAVWLWVRRPFSPTTHFPLLISLAGLGLMLLLMLRPPAILQLQLSPYKGLRQALLNPEARLVNSRWNVFSRVDVVESSSVRSLPGLSLTYAGAFPRQVGVAVDGDHLMPITVVAGGTDWAHYLPETAVYEIRPAAQVLVLEPGGGLAVATALANGAERVTVVESNPLLVEVVRDDYSALTGSLYRDPRVRVQAAGPRSFVRQSDEWYDVIVLALTDPHRPVRSGAYSLGENYLYTVEALVDYLSLLEQDGVLVLSRWLQNPPSETVRLLATVLEALDEMGVDDPGQNILACRSFQTGTLMVKREAWDNDSAEVLTSCDRLRYDQVYAPDLAREQANRFNRLSGPVYFDAYQGLMTAADRETVYRESEFEIAPATDDRPFFFHFFKWEQAPQVLQTLGKSWQPFGGAGYFVLVILLVLATLAAAVFILLPLLLRRGTRTKLPASVMLYFGALGLGFMLVEVPLIQKFILFLDQPTYAFVVVLFAVLLFSGMGSFTARRWRPARILVLLATAGMIYPMLLDSLFRPALAWPLAARLGLTLVALAPLCFLMGVPFAAGLALLETRSGRDTLIPWAWGINGSLSVIASILAAMLALSLGFRWVLWLGALVYAAAAWLVCRGEQTTRG